MMRVMETALARRPLQGQWLRHEAKVVLVDWGVLFVV